MTDRGLNNRLRQRSRRAGLMIGVSMALTIALCVAGFSVIYSALDEFTSDFVSGTDSEPTIQVTESQVEAPTEPPESEQSGEEEIAQTTAESTSEAAPTETTGDNQIEQADDTGEFTPDYQIDAGQTINLRAGPGVSFDRITSLTPEQALQYLGESQPTEDPEADQLTEGQEWMKFRTEDGEEGWVREIDVAEYESGD